MKVYLIGAGPGDAGLLTLRGAHAIAEADTLIYDYLASPSLLALAKPNAEKIYVGKIAGNHALPQDGINALLIEKAKEGKVVARIKGGDPYIFGRGGEEALALVEAGVPFEEIPGISSTIAGPAYAGIPLTHRAYASSVTIITGHEDPTKPGSVHNWDALAKSASTLVFVMGMKNLPEITKNLIAAGLNGQTPAALVYWGTTSRHRSLIANLETLHKRAIEEGFQNPSVIVVGKVVELAPKLNWFEKKPLLGKTVVVTRAREQASATVSMLEHDGAEVIECPTIEINPISEEERIDLREAITNITRYTWLIFTSANGVRCFMDELFLMGLDARQLGPLRLATIGPATAECLRRYGLKADFVPEKFVAESVAEGMIEKFKIEGNRILLARAKEARDILPLELEKAGAQVDVLTVYETKPSRSQADEVQKRIEEGTLDCISFASSSTVHNFLALIPAALLQQHPEIHLASIGPITAQTLADYGLHADINAKEYTLPSLVKEIGVTLGAKPARIKPMRETGE